jgi:hypothetical protein
MEPKLDKVWIELHPEHPFMKQQIVKGYLSRSSSLESFAAIVHDPKINLFSVYDIIDGEMSHKYSLVMELGDLPHTVKGPAAPETFQRWVKNRRGAEDLGLI